MATKNAQSALWALAREQEWVVAGWQLAAAGLTRAAIRHRLREGRLYRRHQGVYAVGRSELSRRGEWIAALLACGWKHPEGPELIALSHTSAGTCTRISMHPPTPVHISLRAAVVRRRAGIEVHRRHLHPADVTSHAGLPVTSPALTLIDLATHLDDRALEHAINEADRLDLISPPSLLRALDHHPRRPGTARLRQILTRHGLELPTTVLEALFLPIAARAGLPTPQTQARVNGFKVDFFWPDLGLVVETDSLRHHRTAAQQARDARRDQAHAAAGLSHVRFSHYQVRFEPTYVERTLARVAARLSGVDWIRERRQLRRA
jgi:hypothetical protein